MNRQEIEQLVREELVRSLMRIRAPDGKSRLELYARVPTVGEEVEFSEPWDSLHGDDAGVVSRVRLLPDEFGDYAATLDIERISTRSPRG